MVSHGTFSISQTIQELRPKFDTKLAQTMLKLVLSSKTLDGFSLTKVLIQSIINCINLYESKTVILAVVIKLKQSS